MERSFGRDFSEVRVHTSDPAAASARDVNATAYTVGTNIVFGAGRFAPETESGRGLLAHELAHVVQQDDGAAGGRGDLHVAADGSAQEVEAENASRAVVRGDAMPDIDLTAPDSLQRRVEMRDVGRGERSGFARLPELIERLNAISQGLTFAMSGSDLTYEVRAGGTLSDFDRQIMDLIDQDAALPLRLTNRHGLLGTRATGFTARVEADAWSSGYVDIDDLLASSDLGLQWLLVHFLIERAATPNYARRIGSASLDTSQVAPAREFERAHRRGIDAEVRLLRGFFGDPTIRFFTENASEVFRFYRNDRRDSIRVRMRPLRGAERGVDATSIEVRTRDGVTHTAEEYRRLLEEERIRAQVERERLRGADEHRAGGGGVPAP